MQLQHNARFPSLEMLRMCLGCQTMDNVKLKVSKGTAAANAL